MNERSIKVLIADDSQVARTVVEKRLENLGFDVIVTENGEDAWEILAGDNPPQLAVLDWVMPDIEGIELCRRIRKNERDHYTYIVMVTMKGAVDDIATALDAGADDFLSKPFDGIELDARVKVGARFLHFSNKLQAANAELGRLSTSDTLTKTLNRTAIVDRLDQEFNRLRRELRPLSVVIFDIDKFQTYNTELGDHEGDGLLVSVAEALKDTCRIYDVVGRFGGDEFMVILPAADEEAAHLVASRMSAAVEKLNLCPDSSGGHLTVSAGTATWHPGGEPTPQATIRAAVAALKRAKSSGSNVLTPAIEADFLPTVR